MFVWWPNIDTLKELFLRAALASARDQILLQLKFVPGYSQLNHGLVLMWNLLDQSLVALTLLVVDSFNEFPEVVKM